MINDDHACFWCYEVLQGYERIDNYCWPQVLGPKPFAQDLEEHLRTVYDWEGKKKCQKFLSPISCYLRESFWLIYRIMDWEDYKAVQHYPTLKLKWEEEHK